MLIRSQDKRKLLELNNITIEVNKYVIYGENKHSAYYNVECPRGVLGKYTTEEKALKVLDMIEEEYNAPIYINKNRYQYEKYEHPVFHMPEDTEVE